MGSITINAGNYVPIIIGRDAGTSGTSVNACSYLDRITIYYDSNYTFATVPVIWLNANETGVPAIGWYSLDAIARYWDGVGFTTSTVCVNTVPISLGFNAAAVGACATVGATYYIAGGQTFATMTAIYTDAALTILAPNGYYSNGTNVRQWTSPTMGTSVLCVTALPISLGDGISSGVACSDGITTTYYMNNTYSFLTTPILYQDVNLLIPVVIGWYSNGINARYWNGSVFSSTVTCSINLYTLYILKTTGVLAGTCTSGITRPAYILSTDTFPTATQIWNNNDGTGIPPIGYYSYGLDVRYWNGLVLGPVQACPTATTSLLLSYGTTAEASCLEPFVSEFWFPTVDLTWSGASSIGTISGYLVSPEVPPISGFYTDSTGTVRQWDSVTRSFLGTVSCSTIISCISIINTIISPIPQSGLNNKYGVKIELSPFPIEDDVTISGNLWNLSNISESVPYSITILAGNQSGETANDILITGAADTAEMSVFTVTPTTVGYLGEAVNFCGYEPNIDISFDYYSVGTANPSGVGGACGTGNGSWDNNFWTNDSELHIGIIIYSNDGVTPFNGGNLCYNIVNPGIGGGFLAIRIGGDGKLLYKETCI